MSRLLERIGGALLMALGVAWLVLGSMSLKDENFFLRGFAIVAVVSVLLVIAGLMLAKAKPSAGGRIFAGLVCALGIFRELAFMDHGESPLANAGWIGIGILGLYFSILILVAVNHFLERRNPTPQ